MVEMPDHLLKIEEMSWLALQGLALKELSAIPSNHRTIFEQVFGREWPQFTQFILSLAEKKYIEITPICKRMSVLTDLSQSDVDELAAVATLNDSQYRSPKIEFYQICRLLHTK